MYQFRNSTVQLCNCCMCKFQLVGVRLTRFPAEAKAGTHSLIISTIVVIHYYCTRQNAMKVMCFTEEEIADVLQVIAGVLQLGNVNFMAAGGAQVAEKSGM